MALRIKIDPKVPLSDFRVFLCLVWRHLGLPDPTPVQYDIAYYLQHGPRRSVIMAFRGVGKSWVTSAFVCWLLLMNPLLKILVVSASKDRSDQFSIFVKRLIAEIPALQHLRPGADQRDSNIAFDVGPATPDHSPSVKSVGIMGQLTGSRADIIVADDVEVPNNSETETQREKLSHRVREFDAVLKPNGAVTYLGTPQTEMSLYNGLPERGYEVRIWPARYPTEEMLEKYGDRLAPRILATLQQNPLLGTCAMSPCGGQPVDPDRFDDEDLLERETSYARSGFMLQFMLNTSLSDAERYPLRVADLMVIARMNHHEGFEQLVHASRHDLALQELPNVAMDGDRFHAPLEMKHGGRPYEGAVMTLDPSGKGRDETGYAVTKQLHGYVYVTRCGGLRGGYSQDTLKEIAQIAEEQGVHEIIVETNWGGSKDDSMFMELLRPVLAENYPCTLTPVHNSGQKEMRIIDTLEPVMNSHRLVLDSKIIEDDYQSVRDMPPEQGMRYQLIYQMTRITKDRGALKHDDRLEALAMGVAHWQSLMRQDAETQSGHARERELQEELRQTKRAVMAGLAVHTVGALGGNQLHPSAIKNQATWAGRSTKGRAMRGRFARPR